MSMLELKSPASDNDTDDLVEYDRKVEPKTRKCLMCGSQFPSAWAGERICRKCKSSSTWRSG